MKNILCYVRYHRVPFFEGYKFHEWTEKESLRKQFSQIYISLQPTIHITIGFLLIFSETKFAEVRKIHKIYKICSPRKRHPTVFYCAKIK